MISFSCHHDRRRKRTAWERNKKRKQSHLKSGKSWSCRDEKEQKRKAKEKGENRVVCEIWDEDNNIAKSTDFLSISFLHRKCHGRLILGENFTPPPSLSSFLQRAQRNVWNTCVSVCIPSCRGLWCCISFSLVWKLRKLWTKMSNNNTL